MNGGVTHPLCTLLFGGNREYHIILDTFMYSTRSDHCCRTACVAPVIIIDCAYVCGDLCADEQQYTAGVLTLC